MTIIIDYREHELLKYCEEHHIAVQHENLLVGDIVIKTEDTTLVFERKTLADLAASIKDGRYHEQKQRLLSTFPFHRITYLIEGSISSMMNKETVFGMSSKALLTAVISAQYRDGFHVIETKNVAETMWYLVEIASRESEKIVFATDSGEKRDDYVDTLRVKTKKIDNITPEVCYLMQLSQLPGISVNTAKEISKTYPTMSALLLAMMEQGIKAFKDIPGLGPKRAKTIIEYIDRK